MSFIYGKESADSSSFIPSVNATHELSAVTVSAHQLIFSCSPLLEHVTAVILFPSDGFPVIMLSHLDLYLNYMLIFLYKEGGESISWINSEQSDNPGRIMHW